jgi:hypothetical protein
MLQALLTDHTSNLISITYLQTYLLTYLLTFLLASLLTN